jgi:peptide methionine sulfoxide reductase msrA/msrB
MAQNNELDTSHLNDLQKHVTLEGGTERAFHNKYWDNKEDGIYVDIITGEPLFSSTDKFDSGTGWPSFTKAIKDSVLNEKVDQSHGMTRTEITSSSSNAHLGHVFDDGPIDKGGKRFCMNSAALKFIPKENLEKKGYGEYLTLFGEKPTKYQKAYLAGGCFWGMEKLFSGLKGVKDVVNGYSGGTFKDPTYEVIITGITGHAETIEVTFDPKEISYEELLRFFFQIHDPTTLNRQGNDIGTQYRSAIFYINDLQKNTAKRVIRKANESGVFDSKVITNTEEFDKFYKAEAYHQDYLKRNPYGYSCHSIRSEWKF